MWLTLPLLGAVSFHTRPMPGGLRQRGLRQEAQKAHAAELSSATATAFLCNTAAAAQHRVRTGQEVEFVAHHVGARYAGPDSEILGPAAASVHVSTQQVFTAAECRSMRLEAQLAMAIGFSSDFTYTDLASIGEVHVADLPLSRRLLRRKLEGTILQAVAGLFGLDAASLRVRDAVVIRYDAAREATRQPVHRDEALVSLSVQLSAHAEYDGGGTFFEGSGEVLTPPMGSLLCHASGMRHAGYAIKGGLRWVLVVFLVSADVPQLARHCCDIARGASTLAEEAEAAAAEARAADAGTAEEAAVAAATAAAAARQRARAALSVALSLAPSDFQLHHDRGLQLLHDGAGHRPVGGGDGEGADGEGADGEGADGESEGAEGGGGEAAARAAFARAAALYPRCPRPHAALAMLLLSECGRPRAALRRYVDAAEAVAWHGGGQDRNLALEIASGAAQCVLQLRARRREARAAASTSAPATAPATAVTAPEVASTVAGLGGAGGGFEGRSRHSVVVEGEAEVAGWLRDALATMGSVENEQTAYAGRLLRELEAEEAHETTVEEVDVAGAADPRRRP